MSYLFNPNDEKMCGRFWDVHRESYRKMQPFRENYMLFLREYLGTWYSDNGTDESVSIPLVAQYVNTVKRLIAARNPRTRVSTRNRLVRPLAANFQIVLDKLFKDICIKDTFQAAVVNALFLIGVVKTGLKKYDTVEIDGYLHDVGQPYADIIDLDDLIVDMSVTSIEAVRFIGNRYKLPLEYVKENKSFKKAVRDILTNDPQYGGEYSDEKASSISQAENEKADLSDMITLWDIWYPLENKLVIYAEQQKKKPLMVLEWNGPESGPFDILGFNYVPSNIMPFSPVAERIDTHRVANLLYNKSADQAERQKDLTIYDGISTEDAKNMMNAADGKFIKAQRADGVKPVSLGGVNPKNFAFMLNTIATNKTIEGNIDILAGSASQSPTLGQDEMLSGANNQQLAHMQDMFLDFAQSVVQKLAWYEYHDPVRVRRITRNIPEVGMSLDIDVTPEDKATPFEELEIDIYPNSMEHYSPQTKLNKIMQYITTVYMPLAPMYAQQGKMLDLEMLNQVVADLSDNPEVMLLMKNVTPPEEGQGGGASHERTMAPNTTRTNVRENRSIANPQGQSADLIQQLMGGEME